MWTADPVDGFAPSGVDEALARYAADPKLAIVETYALDVLGQLSDEEDEEAAHAVLAFFADARRWRDVVRDHMGWDARVDLHIQALWRVYCDEVDQGGGEPDAAEFARRFADEVARARRS